MYNYKLNKKAQVGETISWVVATIVIIGILMIFIYITFLMSKVKSINVENLPLPNSEQNVDLLAEKTSFAHQLDDNRGKEIIDNILKEDEK